MQGSSDTAQEFESRRYCVLRQVLPPPLVAVAHRYYLIKQANGELTRGKPHLGNSYFQYADPLGEAILESLQSTIEEAIGLRLLPTYSYARIYYAGASLRKHQDRNACEISATLTLGYEADEPWPIFIEGPDGAEGVLLEAGDLAIYRGVECTHWRNEFRGERLVQLFNHYVDADGPHADQALDGRSRIGAAGRQ